MLATVCALKPSRSGRRRYTHLTFSQLNYESAQVAQSLLDWGVKPGAKALVMVRPSPELFIVTFGLLRAGIIPIMIDPGMDRSSLKECIATAAPEIFIGIPLAHLARRLFRWGRASIQRTVMVPEDEGSSVLAWLTKKWANRHISDLIRGNVDAGHVHQSDPHATAAILYTSGSTGTPKGAVYLHRHFVEQVKLLKGLYDFRRGAVDVPTFPLFALFDPALGMTAAFPRMDYSAPASANPEEIFSVIEDFGAENMFCSPALLRVLAQAVHPEEVRLKSLKRVISAGAPVPPAEMKTFRSNCHANAEIYTPYGATEALPISSISCEEVVKTGEQGQLSGRGVCVGRLAPGVHLRVIRVTHDAIQNWDDAELLEGVISSKQSLNPDNVADLVGELVIYSGSTTQMYFERPEGDALAKISGAPPGVTTLPGQSVSHRMGDLGYFDQEGRLWLCGRKSHIVDIENTQGGCIQRWLPLCVEGILNGVKGVRRTALIPHQEGPAVCVELDSSVPWEQVEVELSKRCRKQSELKGISGFLIVPEFPVDTRHNAKIKREILARWTDHIQFKPVLTQTYLDTLTA